MINTHPDILKYISFPVVNTNEDFMREVYESLRTKPEECLYAVIDKTATNTNTFSSENASNPDDHNYAGVIALSNTKTDNAVTEIGVITFPAFQRTHVATNAIGLTLLWLLDPPSLGGLGLRRVEWFTHAQNEGSRRAALRMGFEFEGIQRWQRTVQRGKVGQPVEALEKRNGTKEESLGRHNAMFSMVWDEWEEKRPKVVALMERKR